jgi:uncharacterized protein
MTQRTYERLEDLAAAVLDAGFSAIVDATFLMRSQRDRFRAVAQKTNVSFVVIDFATDAETCRRRIRERSRAQSDASEATKEVLSQQLRSSQPLGEDERTFVIPFLRDRIQGVLAEIEGRQH